MLYKNIMTVDLEEWYNGNYLSAKGNIKKISTLQRNTDLLLEIFANNDVKATFFVLGTVAEEKPQLIKRIYAQGHNIACHSYSHSLIYNMSKNDFKEETKKAKYILEDIIGDKVMGYRAPSWSITEKSLWAYEILKELGFSYSSSVFPFKNYLYGIKNFSRQMINVSKYTEELKNVDFFEVPPTAVSFMKNNIPFSGGFYIRALPKFFIEKFSNIVNKQEIPVIFYIHPWELDSNPPYMHISFKENFIRKLNVKINYKKFSDIVYFMSQKKRLTSIEDFYKFR